MKKQQLGGEMRQNYEEELFPGSNHTYVRFAFQGIACEFVVLPCGLSPSPMMFVRCTEAAVGTTQQKGI